MAVLLTVLVVPADAEIIPAHSKTFRKYEDCRFVPTQYNDGDSFRVAIEKDEFVFRLYYVDTPESDKRFPVRNAEQAAYFAITPEKSVEIGKEAGKFVAELLGAKPFTVHTRWSSALGSSRKSRYYAVIQIGGQDLAELLVQNGLARVHGTLVNYPSGLKGVDFVGKLQAAEVKAKAEKKGAWAFSDPKNLPAEPDVVEVPDPEIIRETSWPERFLSAGLGGAFVGALWLLSFFVRRKPAV